MNKCTLLVDGNWLLMSRFAMNKEGFLVDNPSFEKELAKNECVQLMSKSIGLVLSRFEGIIDNMILVCDGQSWRKKVPKPASLDADYKGTRIREEELDWDCIFDCLRMLEDKITKLGFTVSHTFNAEGDDAIWYWKSKLNHDGCNCVIWSSDNDLKQLVSYDKGVFTVWYNDRYGLFASEKAAFSSDDDLDFFMMDSEMQKTNAILESMQDKGEINLKYINPEDVVMEKIICGDKSDNIKAVVRIGKNGKTYSVTPKMWSEVKEELDIKTLDDFFANEDSIIESLYNLKKFRGTTLTLEDVHEQFDYNSKLVWLDDSTIPQEVQEGIAMVPYVDNGDLDMLKMESTIVDQKEQSEVEDLIEDLPF